MLDAGSSLNHLHVLRRLRPRVERLHVVTLSPEERSFPQLSVSYLYADLRDLPIRDESYDHIACVRAEACTSPSRSVLPSATAGSERSPSKNSTG
jgi:hypothetical protein